MREQDRTLECEHSIYGFHKQVNLGERTWNDDLRAMSYSLGIAIAVLVAEQNVILQTSLFTAGMLRSQQPRRRAAEQAVDFCRQIKGSSDFLCEKTSTRPVGRCPTGVR